MINTLQGRSLMKTGRLLSFLICLNIYSFAVFAENTNLYGINFYQKGELSFIEFSFDKEGVDLEHFHVKQDKQLIIDFKKVDAGEKVLRGFDASEFPGAIAYISPYVKPGSKGDVRINVQLRDNVRSVVQQLGKRVVLKVENRFGVFSEKELKKEKLVVAEKREVIGKINIPKSDSVVDILENLTLSGRKKYIGKKVSFDVKDVKVEDLLKMIADASGFNIIITDEVKKLPSLTLSLINIPWDQALDTILGLNKLVAEKNGAILMITSLDKATEEKKKEIEVKKLLEKEEKLVAKVFPISFAKIDELLKILEGYLTKERGNISADNRTNSIIVKDTVQTIEKIKKIIKVLDTQTPQVLIESKIVEVREEHKKEIGLQSGGDFRGFQFGYDPLGTPGSGNASVGDSGAGTAFREAGPGFQFSTAPTTTASTLFSVEVSKFNRFFNLNFALSLMESESKARVISSPKVITQNKETAKITATDTTSFKQITGVGDAATTTFEQIDATLSLEVTPQVTNDGSISMQISLDKEQFGSPPVGLDGAPPTKASRSVKTNVLVDNGSTVVIGGIYNYEKSSSHAGLPFLKDIPLIGWIFRTPFNPAVAKNEMIIFITPRIINQDEAGLSVGQI